VRCGRLAEENLRRTVRFADTFPDEQIAVALIRQLNLDGWGVRTLESESTQRQCAKLAIYEYYDTL
jgi:hypothetical protein